MKCFAGKRIYGTMPSFFVVCAAMAFGMTLVLRSSLGEANLYNGTSHRRTLLRDLFRFHDVQMRPVVDNSKPVKVSIRLKLYQIRELNEKHQRLYSKIWLNFEWKDEFLVWNSSEYGGLDYLYIPMENIWIPEVILLTSADADTTGLGQYPRLVVQINSDGSVWWSIPMTIQTVCRVNIQMYPFDTQRCNLTFSGWLQHAGLINITSNQYIDALESFEANPEWEVLSVPCLQYQRYYHCCKDPFPEVTCTIVIRRKPLFYIFNIVLPCLLLKFVGLLTFALPQESGERISLSVTILLAMTVFLMMVEEKIPANSDSVPLLGQLIGGTILLLAITTAESVIVLSVHQQGQLGRTPSVLFRKLVFGYVAPVVFMGEAIRQHQSNTKENELALAQAPANVPDSKKYKTAPDDIPWNGKRVAGNKSTETSNQSRVEEAVRARQNVKNVKAEQMSTKDIILEEWKLFAHVLDRMCLIIIMVSTLVMFTTLCTKIIIEYSC